MGFVNFVDAQWKPLGEDCGNRDEFEDDDGVLNPIVGVQKMLAG